ncbi:helix-turn-helix transcriptional regulator [Amycolatopsis sp. NPDC051071]|uniref:helix-turn-helix transcriptional regulator n=1 Tax=Amycolatopsis sp. NPDC051071 TaxID=3154637 RepID=UPI003420B2B4
MDSRYVADAGRRRAELARTARWADADAVVREVLEQAAETGGVLPDLVYLPGCAALGIAATEEASAAVAEARRHVVEAMLLTNRGTDRRQAISLVLRALEESGYEDVLTFWCGLMTLLHADEFALAERECATAASLNHWSRFPARRRLLDLIRGRMCALSGKLREARSVLAELAKVPSGCGEVAAIWLVEVFAELGDVSSATDLLHAHGMLGSIAEGRDRPLILAARGAVEFAAGRFEQGLENFIACGRELSGWSVFNPAVVPWRSRAALCASALQRCDLAISLAQDDLMYARSWGTPWTRGAALHALGLARCDEHSAQYLREAVTAILQGTTQSERIRVSFDLGLYHWRRLDFEDARRMLTTARNFADDCESRVWSDRSRVALGRLNGDITTTALTEREALIGGLARAGLSNKEIAEHANLTVRTVEQHLSSVYRKLGISGRSDMAYAMVNPCFSA